MFFFSGASIPEQAEAIDGSQYYGTLAEANEYFAEMLNETWTESPVEWRPIALYRATIIIDTLNYKGTKRAVYLLDSPSRDEIIAADTAQPLEFPRGGDTVVPVSVRYACYEIAAVLLAGEDSQDQVDALDVQRQAYGAVRTTYGEPAGIRAEQIVHGVPLGAAWRLLRPYLTGGPVRKPRV